MSTKYEVFHYDPRGAWRSFDECGSLTAAKRVVKTNELTKWKIFRVDTVLVSQSEEDLPKVSPSASHFSG